MLDLLSPENARFFPLAPLVNLLEQCGLKMECPDDQSLNLS